MRTNNPTCAGLPFLSQETKSGPVVTYSWWHWGGGGVVLAMSTTGGVDEGTPVDRGEARPAMGCGAAGEGCGVRGDGREPTKTASGWGGRPWPSIKIIKTHEIWQ